MTKYITTAVAAGALAFGVAQTSALPFINGSLLLSGSGSASVSGGVTTVTPNSPMSVVVASGNYSAITPGTSVNVNPLSYTGTGLLAALTAPVTPEWSVSFGGVNYSFDLTALQTAVFTSGASSSVAVSGSGTAFATGFAPTAATWSFSGTGNGFNFAVASQQTTATGVNPPPVPDGGATAVLLGLATVGFAAVRRKLS